MRDLEHNLTIIEGMARSLLVMMQSPEIEPEVQDSVGAIAWTILDNLDDIHEGFKKDLAEYPRHNI